MSLADTHWETVIGCFNLAIFKEMNRVGLGSASPQKNQKTLVRNNTICFQQYEQSCLASVLNLN